MEESKEGKMDGRKEASKKGRKEERKIYYSDYSVL